MAIGPYQSELSIMQNSEDVSVFNPSEEEVRFPHTIFTLAILLHFFGALTAFWLIAPATLSKELSQGALSIIAITFILGLPLSLFEFAYHRYLLHSAVLPFMRSMNKAHAHHHDLTDVTLDIRPETKGDDGKYPVKNEYAIEHPHQMASMMFPLYSLGIFYLIFGILLALPLKLVFPEQPIILSTLLVVTLYITWYEVWHMIQHLPYTKFWKPRLYGSKMQRIWRRIYNFHLVHHFKPTMNMAVVGFWGAAIWDHVFKTCYRMPELPVPGARVDLGSSTLTPKPVGIIRKIDSWKSPMYRWSRKVEDWGRRLLRLKKPVT